LRSKSLEGGDRGRLRLFNGFLLPNTNRAQQPLHPKAKSLGERRGVPTFDQYGIAKFVAAVAALLER
jgi:hypothetical protein